MSNNLCPEFLCNLVPQTVGNSSRYSLRNSNNVQSIPTRANYHFNSFLPSSVREWNNISEDIRNSDSVSAFKYALKKELNLPLIPNYFRFGTRKLQVLHTRLRTNCSALNNDLFLKNMSDSPFCACGQIEDADHFLLHCIEYADSRNMLYNSLSSYPQITTQLLLYGNPRISDDSNIIIFSAVHNYIQNTNRF